MRKFFLMIFALALFHCGGASHGERPRVRSADELKLSGLAQQLEDKADGLVKQAPPELSPNVASFAENAARFNNTAQRFGPRSLEARDAYDKLYFQQNQLDEIMTEKNYPKLIAMWQSIKQDILTIGKQLGYKIGG